MADACDQLNARLAPYKEKLPEGSFREVVNAAYFDRVDLSAHGFYKTPDVTGFGGTLPFNYFTFGASCSEVELDTLTGESSGATYVDQRDFQNRGCFLKLMNQSAVFQEYRPCTCTHRLQFFERQERQFE